MFRLKSSIGMLALFMFVKAGLAAQAFPIAALVSTSILAFAFASTALASPAMAAQPEVVLNVPDAHVAPVDLYKLNVLQSGDALESNHDDLNSRKHWRLIWNCEFDSPSDLKKWNVVNNWDNANNELQAYRSKACTVHDGYLFIEARKEDTEDGGKKRHFTSGKLDTRKKFAVRYGRFDCRFKVPRGKGYWPAFWMLPSSGNWPPEIDWMEILGHRPQILEVTNHFGTHRDGFHPWHGPKRYELHPDFSEEFHTLSGIWNEREIVCYVDGKRISVSQDGVPREKMYMILNLAVGGDLPGPPDDHTPFPSQFVVDFVRVYDRVN